MTAVELLARELCWIKFTTQFPGLEHWKIAQLVDTSWHRWTDEAGDMVRKIQAPHRALIERWKKEADELEASGVRHYGVNWLREGDQCTARAKELRRRAAEVERALGGEG